MSQWPCSQPCYSDGSVMKSARDSLFILRCLKLWSIFDQACNARQKSSVGIMTSPAVSVRNTFHFGSQHYRPLTFSLSTVCLCACHQNKLADRFAFYLAYSLAEFLSVDGASEHNVMMVYGHTWCRRATKNFVVEDTFFA